MAPSKVSEPKVSEAKKSGASSEASEVRKSPDVKHGEAIKLG